MIGTKRQNYSVRVTVKKSLKGRHSRFLIPTTVVYFRALYLYYGSVRKVGMEVLKVLYAVDLRTGVILWGRRRGAGVGENRRRHKACKI